MDLADIRQAIDSIDTTLLNSFVERMDIATEVAKSKIEMGKAVFDPARERSKLNNLASRAPERYEAQTITLFRLLMSMSKAEQQRYINELKGITVSQKAHATAVAFDAPFPQTASVACQGVEGAYSQIAACKLFDVPDIAFFETFEGVMRAVRDGFCEFGVLPIENSTAGSVNAVYDLLAQFDFHIVRSLRLKIDHNLLVKPGTKLADVREVYSHGQAIAQCAGFIESHDLHATKYPNTAMSAEMIASSERTDVAAIASRSCAALYGLEVLEPNIQDSDNNYTRLVVISRDAAPSTRANRTSLTASPRPTSRAPSIACSSASTRSTSTSSSSRAVPSPAATLSLCSTLIWTAPLAARPSTTCSIPSTKCARASPTLAATRRCSR